MHATIFLNGRNTSTYCVEWCETDGFVRQRHFGAYSAAELFARQLECRLAMEQLSADRSRARVKNGEA